MLARMQSRSVPLMLIVGVGLTLVAVPVAGAADCFEDIEQIYQWDDGGHHWSVMPDRCPGSSQPAAAIERKWGGNVTVRASGHDAIVIEESYAWMPRRHGDTVGCPRFFKTTTRKTRIAKDGVLYEMTQVDGEPARRSQRTMGAEEVISVTPIAGAPSLGDAYVQVLGASTVAGQPCKRVAPKRALPAAAKYEMCVFVAPARCPLAKYLQPLDLRITGPDGQLLWHAYTTSLRYGARGTVVAPGSIRAP